MSPSWTFTIRPDKFSAIPANGRNARATKTQRNLNMPDLTGYDRLAQLTKLTDRMIDDASKEAVVTAASILAIQMGHYQRKFGVIPMDEALDLLETDELSDDQAGWVADGLENLAVVLSSIDAEGTPPQLQ